MRFRSFLAGIALTLFAVAGVNTPNLMNVMKVDIPEFVSPTVHAQLGPIYVDVQTYTSTGANTWTKLGGAKWVRVVLIGGGGGGGSGRKGAAGTIRSGGGGGGGAGVAICEFPAALLATSETVTVGAGSAGGTAISASDTNGNTGTAGVATTFGGFCRAGGGNAGVGGDADGSLGGLAPLSYPDTGAIFSTFGKGGDSSATGALGGDGFVSVFNPSGGGAGGGITSGNSAGVGGVGGVNGAATVLTAYSGWNTGVAGGTSGPVSTIGGTGQSVTAGTPLGGTGGGGGGGSTAATGGTGGAGGIYGAGGGGGGAAVNAVGNSGAGGVGGNGIAIVTTYF